MAKKFEVTFTIELPDLNKMSVTDIQTHWPNYSEEWNRKGLIKTAKVKASK